MKKVMMVFFVMVSMIVKADLTPFIICDNPSAQSTPAIDGGLAVWVDDRGGIYAKMLPAGVEQAICNELGVQSNPAVSGSVIVWQDGRKQTADEDIYGYDFNTGTPLTICADSVNQQYPDISGRIVVWQEGDGTNRDIWGINLDGGDKFLICGNEYDQAYPAISGRYVVWQDNRNGGYDIYCRNLDAPAGSEFPVCGASGDQVYPDIDGNLIVWQDPRNESSNDIYGYDLGGSGEFEVCVRTERQNQPAVSGSWIVWRDRRNNSTTGYDIYGYNYSSKAETMICTAAGHQNSPAVSAQYVIWQDGTLLDIHGAAFPVQASITVTQPNGNETWMAGRQQQVQWQSTGAVSTVKIELYNGSGWQTLADSAANSGSLNVTIPAGVNSNQCLVKVSDAANLSVTDQSNAVFTIFQCMLKADLTGDCYVDMADLAELAKQWLQCGNPFDVQWCQNN
jgi:beta propeller repeat protein